MIKKNIGTKIKNLIKKLICPDNLKIKNLK